MTGEAMKSWNWMRAWAFGTVLVVGLASAASAQTYPNRPIRMIAPFDAARAPALNQGVPPRIAH